MWGEDAWCYVPDKAKLVIESARVVRSGGTIAFTDWVEGPAGLAAGEAERYMRFMKFPTLASIDGYADLLRTAGCTVHAACDTGRFAPYVDLYMNMLTMQLGYDALKILGFDQDLLGAIAGEFAFVRRLRRGKDLPGAVCGTERVKAVASDWWLVTAATIAAAGSRDEAPKQQSQE